MSGRWPADLDPDSLRQPDGLSCGAATVVAAHALHDPAYRPADPDAEIRRVHRALTGTAGPGGGAQMPWPRALGTPPWSVAEQLEQWYAGPIRTFVARWRPEAGYDALRDRLADRPAAVYIGSAWLPRHIVLALDDRESGVRVFDPARGVLVTVARERWVEHRVAVAGWSHLWAVV